LLPWQKIFLALFPEAGRDGAATFYMKTVQNEFILPVTQDKDQTLSAALTQARKLRKRFPAKDIRIELCGGRHALDQTLLIDSSLTHERGHLVFSSARGVHASLSGGKIITGWEHAEVNGVKCWVTKMPEVQKGQLSFTQLWVNGKRRERPRLPKKGFYHFTGFDGQNPKAFDWYNGPDRMEFKKGDIGEFHDISSIDLTIYQLWFEMRHRIKSLDPGKSVVHFGGKSTGHLLDEKNEYARYFLDNVFECLSDPGEWYLDRPTGKLYYIPLEGETPEHTEVIAPVIGEIIRIEGSSLKAPAQNVLFENLRIEHADFRLPAGNCGYVQACVGIPAAIHLSNARHCVFYGCEISHVAQYGLEIGSHCHGNKVVACHFQDLGAGGVKVYHETGSAAMGVHEPLKKLSRDEKQKQNFSSSSWITDCTIHDGGKIFPSAIGIWIGDAGGNRILHNHIYDMNYTGISTGWVWGYGPTRTQDNRIEYNHVHHINWNEVLSDNGAIYTLGRQPGSTIKSNVVHHVSCYGYGGWGIYPDEGSSELLIEGNLVYRTGHAGFSTHYGKDLWVRNNIFAYARDAHFNPGRTEGHRTSFVERNIIAWDQGEIKGHSGLLETSRYLFRNNLFYKKIPGPVMINGIPLEEWQRTGQFAGSLLVNPLFTAIDADDYSLRGDSPAIKKMGFNPLDISQAGPRYSGKLPTHYSKWAYNKKTVKNPVVSVKLSFRSERPAKIKGFTEIVIEGAFTNTGSLAAKAKLSLSVECERKAQLLGPNQITVRVAPSKTLKKKFTLLLPSLTPKAVFSVYPDNDTFRPTCCFCHPPKAKSLTIKRAPSVDFPEQIAVALADSSFHMIRMAHFEIAKVRFGIFGNALGLCVDVIDLQIEPNHQMPWGSSSIEVNFAPANAQEYQVGIASNASIKQTFIVPSTTKTPAQLYQFANPFPALEMNSRVKLDCQPRENGYRMTGIIPLKEAGLEANCTEFMVEFQINGKVASHLSRLGNTAFGSTIPNGNIEYFAHIKIEG